MKSKLTFFTLLLIINISFGQSNKYYMNKLGNIIDQKKYDTQKNNSLKKIQKNMKSMQIVEDLNELYKRNDSIVYSYAWHFTDSPKKTIKEIARKKAIIGKEYPIENEITLSGKKISLDDLKGKQTLINLWFTGCAPCIEEMPVLNELKSKYGDKFNFLSVTYDSESKVNKLLEKHKFEFEHIVNSKKLTTKLGFNGFPVNLFLDKNGVVKIIEGNVNYTFVDGELKMGDGMEFIQILEKLL
jgi:cytochrome c biogenesis protein CcmG/thiol:disulfide interchange protein DsbE